MRGKGSALIGVNPVMIVHADPGSLTASRDLLQGARAAHGKDPLDIEMLDLDEIAFVHGAVFISLARITEMQIGSATGVATITLNLRPHEAAVIKTVGDEMKKQPPF